MIGRTMKIAKMRYTLTSQGNVIVISSEWPLIAVFQQKILTFRHKM